jgi:cellulose 1,4-beta-cellobiosidase
MRLLPLFVILGTLVSSCAKAPVVESGAGGAVGSGGAAGTGGKIGTGGTASNGGTTSTGGRTGTGGATSNGGTTSTTPASVDCPDTSTYSSLVVGAYGATQVPVDNNSNKNYEMQANWWGKPYNNQQEQQTGLGFSMTNPGNAITSVTNTPMGYPSIYIGSYQCRATKGSNLPKQISSLTSVPTIFSTNADSMGLSNYVADYDVWLTQSSSVLGCSASDPGAGGAFLMVWLFKPSDRQPKGSAIANGRIIDGVSGSWTVWADTLNPPCVSYVSDTKLSELQFDLNLIIQDAVKQKYGNISGSQYLSIIFAGFEVWGGGDGLKVNRFCANVK